MADESVPFEVSCKLQYLANGEPGASYTYNADGTVTASAVPDDIPGTVGRALSVIETSDWWHEKLRRLIPDFACVYDPGDVKRDEISRDGTEISLELWLGDGVFQFVYDSATGVLTTKARAEATFCYGLYRYLYKRAKDFLALLPQE